MTQPIPKSAPPIGRGPGSLIAGATYPARALWLFIKTPRLRGYILMPILVNVLLGITIYAGLLMWGMRTIDAFLTHLPLWTNALSHETSDLVAAAPHLPNLPSWHFPWFDKLPAPNGSFHLPHWQGQLPHWLPRWSIALPGWVSDLPNWGLAVVIGVIRLLLTLVLLLLTGFIFLQFGVLLGAPWYGKLSEEIEVLKTGQLVLVEVNPLTEVGRALLYELNKLALVLPLTLLLLLLNVLPGLGTTIASFAGTALAGMIACLDFLDAAVERRRSTFRQKLNIVWRSLPASGSFGIVCLGLASIPLVNLVAIPICVAAGTLFFCDRVLPWLKDGNN